MIVLAGDVAERDRSLRRCVPEPRPDALGDLLDEPLDLSVVRRHDRES
jgi:hypothetical protein